MMEILVLFSFLFPMGYLYRHHLSVLLALEGVPYASSVLYYLILSGLWFFPMMILLKYCSGSLIMTSYNMLSLVKGSRRKFVSMTLLVTTIRLMILLMIISIIGLIIGKTKLSVSLLVQSLIFYMTVILVMMLLELIRQKAMALQVSVVLLAYELLSNIIPRFDILKYYMGARGSFYVGMIIPLFILLLAIYYIAGRKDYL